MFLRNYIIAWIPMVGIAIINGWLREKTYGPRIGELRAHQVSCVTGVFLFGLYIWILGRIWPLTNDRQAAVVGGVWLILTVAFEFLFGRFIAGHSWHRLVDDYNLRAGRLWLVVLAWVAIAPMVLRRV